MKRAFSAPSRGMVSGASAAVASLALVGMLASTSTAEVLQLSDVAVGAGGFAIDGISSADLTGQTVAPAGDFNGDGLGDVVIGARESGGFGRAFVVFGKTNTTLVNLAALGSAGVQVNGQAATDDLGISVAGVGDVNGDGLSDVVIGAPYNDGGAGDAGRAYVLFGRTNSGVVEASSLAIGVGGFVVTNTGGGEQFGKSVGALGDVNGDGLADFGVGNPFGDVGLADTGSVIVVFGKTSTTAVSATAIAAGSGGGFALHGEASTNRLGYAIGAAGDMNGDGLGDIVVGTNRFTGVGTTSGRTYVVFGKTSTAAVSLTTVSGGAGGFVLNGEAAFDNSGVAVCGVGDMTGDARSEVIVGAWGADPPGAAEAGRAYVQFGTSATAAINLSSITAGTSGFTTNGETTNNRLGRSIFNAGDVDGDGLGDIIAGAYQNLTNAGAAYVINGRPSTEQVNTTSLASGFSGRVFRGEAGSTAGRAVAGAGDVNGDGAPDFVIGAPLFNTSAGRVYVVHGLPLSATAGTYRSFLRSGAVSNVVGIGDPGTGAWPPDSRVAIGYGSGTLASTETATLTRSKAGVSGFTSSALANVRWELGTTRSGWATATVRLHYTDAMIAGLTEANLNVYRASSLAGPWTVLPTTVTANRNFVTATTSNLGHFVLATSAPDASGPTVGHSLIDATTTDLDAVRFSVSFGEPVAPTFTAADVTVTGTLTGGTVVGVGGTDPNYVVVVRALDPNANGTVGITLGTAITDAVGNAHAGSSSPNYTIANFGRADINKDSVVNVADVTALANHIVNGDPLP